MLCGGKEQYTLSRQAQCGFESTMNSSLIPVILAGGKGERFWPLSRKHRPSSFKFGWSKASYRQQLSDYCHWQGLENLGCDV